MADSDIEQLAADADSVDRGELRHWAGKPRMILAIIFTDIVDSTLLAVEKGDVDMRAVRAKHFMHSGDLISLHEGHTIKTIGDSSMAVFATAEAAFLFARALRENPGADELTDRVRAGIHVGPMDIEKDDVFGVAVNFAARVVHAVAGPDIGVSAVALEHLRAAFGSDRTASDWAEPLEAEMKGFGIQSVYLYRPAMPGTAPARPAGRGILRAPARVAPAQPQVTSRFPGI